MNIKVIAISVLACYFLFAVVRFSIGLILPDLRSDFNLTGVEAGGFSSTLSLSSAMTISLAGYASDRLGRRSTLVLGSAFLFSGTYFSSIVGSYTISLVSIFLAGAGTGFLIPSVYSIMGSVKPKSRGLYIGLTASVYNWAGFVGSWIMGNNIARLGWRFSFGFLGLVGLICTPVVWLALRSMSANGFRTTAPRKASYGQMLKSKSTFLLSVAMLCRGIGAITFLTWLPAYLQYSLGLDIAQAGIIIGIYSAAGGVSAVLTGLISDRLGEKHLILVTLIAAAVLSFVLFEFANTFIFAALMSALVGFVVFPTWNLGTSLGQRMTDPTLVGSITGLLQNSALAGGVVGPLLAGVLMSEYSPSQAMFFSVSIPLLLAGLAVVPINRKG